MIPRYCEGVLHVFRLGFLFCCVFTGMEWYIDLVLSDWINGTRRGFACVELVLSDWHTGLQ